MITCALLQRGVKIESHLRRLVGEEISFYPFQNFQQLRENPKRYEFDVIIIAAKGNLKPELSAARQIAGDTILALLPVLFFVPTPTESARVKCYRAGADQVFGISDSSQTTHLKLKNILLHSRKKLGVNPSTKLPGVTLIDEEIARRTKKGERFALCYADLDLFKAYNDYYGYYFGNQLIISTSKIIKDVVSDLTSDGFVGHIGGDDYVFIIPLDKVKRVCEGIIKVFDQTVPSAYHERDIRRGYILTASRDGVMQRFPIMSISIAVFRNLGSSFSHIAEISHMLADLKKYVKSLPGSNYVLERRKRY